MILLIVDLGNVWGGQEVYTYQLMKGYRDLGHTVVSVSSKPKHQEVSDVFYQVSPSYSQFIQLRKKIQQLVQLHNISIVHFNGNRAMYLAAICSLPCPKIATKHLPFTIGGQVTYKDRIAQIASSLLFKAVDRLICVAQATYDDLPSSIKSISQVIVNGVPDKYRENIALGNEFKVTLCYIARLVEHKGIHHLIDATEQLINEGFSIQLHVAGQGPLEELVRSASTRCPKQIIYHGFTSEPEVIYNQSMICCLPSLHEGMPLNILEALSCGLPILTTNIPGINEVVSLRNGWLMNNNSVATIKQTLLEILGEQELISQKAKAAREDYEAYYSVDKMVTSTLAVYQSVLLKR